MTIQREIFRAYDIRGIVDETLTEEAVRSIGQAIGTIVQQKGETSIITGRDGRLSGPKLIKALHEGFLQSGCDVIDVGVVPTPVLYFATQVLGVSSGVMLTGSHNPPNYNGIKTVVAGNALVADDIERLYLMIENGQLNQGEGALTQCNDILDQYVARIASDITLQKPMKIVIDCGNGVAGCIAERLYQTLGCEVVPLYCEVDGNFPNHHPDPSKPENLSELVGAVQAHQADVGLAFDGDGDRLGVVTNEGEVIFSDRQIILYAQDVLSRNPGAMIVYDVKCTRFLPEFIKKAGGEPLMWQTGHSFIKAKMKETGALLGGEMSGHIFFKERWYGFDDALYTGARLLEILSKSDKSSHGVFAAIPNSINTPELNVLLTEKTKWDFIRRFVEHAQFKEATISKIDGLRADFKDGWGLVRVSNTTPNLVIRFEADNEPALNRIKEDFKMELKKIEPDMELPF